MVGDRTEPVEIGEHLLGIGHDGLDPVGDFEHPGAFALDAQAARDFLDHLVARVGNGIDRVAEADYDFLCRDAPADVGLRFFGVAVALLHFERDLVGAAMLRPAQRADRACYRGIEIRAGACDRARGERRGVVLVLGVEDQRGMHRALVRWRRLPAVEQMQEVRADRIIVGFDVDPAAVVGVVVPVQQHRSK